MSAEPVHPPWPYCPHDDDPHGGYACPPCQRARHITALPETLVIYGRFAARFTSPCGLCDERVREGDDAAAVGEDYDSRVTAHRSCAEEA